MKPKQVAGVYLCGCDQPAVLTTGLVPRLRSQARENGSFVSNCTVHTVMSFHIAGIFEASFSHT